MTPKIDLFSLIFSLFIGTFSLQLTQAQTSELSVEKIMQDPQWMGTFPSDIEWGAQSESIYFDYNPDKNPADSLYKININNPGEILKVSLEEKRDLIPNNGDFNAKRTEKVYVNEGILYLYNMRKDRSRQLLELDQSISNPRFMKDEEYISFTYVNNAYRYNLEEGALTKLTHIKEGKAPEEEEESSDKNEWLEEENLELLQVVREREENKEKTETYRDALDGKDPYTFYLGERSVSNIEIAPSGDYISFNLITREDEKSTKVPNYVNASGYTEELSARSKVGDDKTKVELALYNVKKDTIYLIKTDNLPGITDLPDYTADYPDKEWEEKKRKVILSQAYFSPSGEKAVVNIRSKDNKDRWIARLDLEDGSLESLDRQRDEAWIAGPGLGWSYGGGTLGWLPDNEHIYFQSEASGYSHLYTLNVENGTKTDLTPGDFEVFDPFLSNDKKSWYLTTSQVDAGERHFYKMPLMGGNMEQLTQMQGNNEVQLSPDEKYMAIRHSYSNKPWELYLKRTRANTKAEQLTNGQSAAFKNYSWREPEYIKFKAEDGAMVPARLYVPADSVKNNAAVVFVHGAGYLQNVHKWWSSYFREYMFNNMLTDLGYTVIDIDYRGSAGYGRDWRTAIYRHMGGKDLSDQVDGVEYLVENYGINPEKVGIYGGSYGGFITLMAMFNAPETFQAGAALRSVTDWAHYNHGYTSNILNEPADDPKAYRRSSPIYFAEGLEGDLLIEHGMVDTNVHFQDVVRLTQRLIELGKEDWEMAIFPVESHGFVEPSSWTDEYRRILKLFNESLLGKVE